MQLHHIKRKNADKKSVQVGRGGKRGKTSGRGTKGQNARAGHKKRPELRDFIKRIPKLRGRGKSSFKSFEVRAIPVALSTLEKNFKAGDRVEPKILVKKGILEKLDGVFPRVKILSGGDISKALTISGCEVSKGAKAAIEKAGGTVHA